MLHRIRDRYLQSGFARNVALVFTGNSLAIVIPLLLAPLISRLYTPEDFAAFELFITILGLTSVVSCLRFELAILLPRAGAKSDAIIALCFRVLLISCAVHSLLWIPLREVVGHLLDNPYLSELLWLLPVAILLTGFLQIFVQWLIREQKFKRLASNKIGSAVANNLTKYLGGLYHPSGSMLAMGHVLGLAAPVAGLLTMPSLRAMLRRAYAQRRPWKNIFQEYRNFPLLTAPHSLFDEGQKALLVFLVSAWYGEVILGLFAFSLRYLRAPLLVFGHALAQVLNEKLARDYNVGISLRPAVIRIMVFLAAGGFVPFGILFWYGEPIFAFVFGSTWTVAGTYAQVLTPWLYLHFIVGPFSMLPLIVDRQKSFFITSVLGNLITLALVWWLGSSGADFSAALLAITASYAGFMLFQLLWFIHIAGRINPHADAPPS